MTQKIIVTTPTNSGNGTPLNTAFDYINDNFAELYGGSTGNAISNGTSNVTVVSANGNISTSVGGTANVMVVSSTSVAITGDLSVSGNATLSGNILGDRIVNGTTELDIQVANGNANLTIGGTSNVVVWATTGEYVTGLISASGNVTGAYILGNGSQLTGVATSYGNSNVVANLAALGSNPVSTTGNVNGGNILTAGLISATGNVNVGNLINAGLTSVAGNITGGNILTAGLISATGNITGGNLTSTSTSGGRLTVLGSTPTTANTAGGDVYLQSGAGNGTSIGGNILLIAGVSGNSTVSSAWGGDVRIYAGNTTGNTGRGGNVRIYAGRGNGNSLFSGAVSLSAGTAEGGSGATGAVVSLSGGQGNTSGLGGAWQLTAGTSYGTDKNGVDSYLLGSPGTGAGTPGNIWIQIATSIASGNTAQTTANVVGFVPTGVLVTGLVSASGNVTGGNVLTGGLISAASTITGTSHLGTVVSVSGNVTGGNILTAGLVSATGNVTGNYFIGNGSQLTGITASAGAAITNGTSNVTAGASGNITVGVAGTSNVIVWATTGQYVTGLISANGNVTGGNLLTAGLISAASTVTGTSHLGSVVSVSGNVTGGNVIFGSGIVSGTGNIFAGNLVVAGNTATITTANYSIGYLNVPQVSLASNITTALVDSGKHYYSTNSSNSTLTVADNSAVSWPVGTSFIVVNRGTGNVTIAAASGVSLYLAGNSTAANRVLTTYGLATCLNLAANVWMISGSGLA